MLANVNKQHDSQFKFMTKSWSENETVLSAIE